jgi:hypothetical protein
MNRGCVRRLQYKFQDILFPSWKTLHTVINKLHRWGLYWTEKKGTKSGCCMFMEEKLEELSARREHSCKKFLEDALHRRLSFKDMNMNNHKTHEIETMEYGSGQSKHNA